MTFRTTTTRATALVALISACPPLPAYAQGDPAAVSATREGSAEGDPSGAIRSLGGISRGDAKPKANGVEIPRVPGNDISRTGGVPPGTTAGGRPR